MHHPDVIAERRLHVLDDPARDVVLRIHRPTAREGGDAGCRIEVTGLAYVHDVIGIDGVQALELALGLLPAILQNLLGKRPGLRWDEAPVGDFGLRRAE